ncbi:MAG TPA: hypothetical protein V6D10_11435 [Trichocoleus sp.]
MELVENRLTVGNTIVGSRLLLRRILQGWKADAAIALASTEMWIEALKIGFNLSCSNEESDVSDPPDLMFLTSRRINELHSWYLNWLT